MNQLWLKTGGFIACLLLLASCSLLFPHAEKPHVNIPDRWQMGAVNLDSGENLPYLAWWNQFQDPALNELIEIGLHVNNNVQQARAKLSMAKEELRSIQLSWLPSISGYAGYSDNPAFGAPGAFYGLWPGYFAFNVFMTLARQTSAKIAIDAQRYALQSTKLVLIGQIATSYYIYIAEVEQLRLFENHIKDLQELLAIQKDNYQGGIGSLIPYVSLKQRLEQAESKKQVIKYNIVKSQNALRYLLNQNPGFIPKHANFRLIRTTYPTFGTLPARVLANRPDVAFAEAQYRLASQQVAVARATLLPNLQLDDFIGGISRSPRSLNKPASLITDTYTIWSIDPAIFGEIGALHGAAKAAYFAYVDMVRKALRDVANDFSAHQTANARHQELQHAYHAALERYHLDLALYKQGIQTDEILLNDRVILVQVALELNSIKLIQMVSLVNLYQDLGGGYCQH